MALSNVQRDIVCALAGKLTINQKNLRILDAAGVTPPADLETELTAQIDTKREAIRQYKLTRPATRLEYVAGIKVLENELAVILTQNEAIKARNAAKWTAANETFSTQRAALVTAINGLQDRGSTAIAAFPFETI